MLDELRIKTNRLMEQEDKRTLVWALWNLTLTVNDKAEFEERALKCIDDTLAISSNIIPPVSYCSCENRTDNWYDDFGNHCFDCDKIIKDSCS